MLLIILLLVSIAFIIFATARLFIGIFLARSGGAFSNMDAPTGYKLQTIGTLVQGVAPAAAVWVASVVAL